MIEQLFGSKTRVKLLQLFYSNPNRSFYVREITRKIDEQISSVRRELSNLLSIGIISSDNNSSSDNNNKLYYEVNQSFEFYSSLLTIFGNGEKAAVVSDDAVVINDDKKDLKTLGNVELVLYTGQFTRDDSAGIDVLLVGDINQTALQKFMTELEKKEGKSLRYTVLKLADFIYRRQINDRFTATVIDAKKQVLIDKNNLLINK